MATDKVNQIKGEEDITSLCGSLGGETFTATRKRNSCTLRQHSIFSLTKSSDLDSRDQTELTKQQMQWKKPRPRLNKSFHYYRFYVVMMSGLATGLMYLQRYNVTLAILKMVNQTAIYIEEHPNGTIADYDNNDASDDDIGQSSGEFDWDNEVQQMIMSWYMVAYTLPQVPLTGVAKRLGVRKSVFISLTISSISTLLVPIFAYFGWQWVIALRLLNGLGASPILSSVLMLIENWMPYSELSLGLTFSQILQSTMLSFNPLISGYLSSIHWKWAFYCPAGFTFLFCILWVITITERPDDCWLVSEKELGTICGCGSHESHLENGTLNSKAIDGEDEEDKPDVTVLDILKMPSFYAFLIIWIIHCSSASCFNFIMPTYMRHVLKIPISKNGIYNFIIQCGCIVAVIWPHPFLSSLRNRFGLSETSSRRIGNIIVSVAVFGTCLYVGWFSDFQVPLLFTNRCFSVANDVILTGTLMLNYAKIGGSSLAFSMINTVGNLGVVVPSAIIGWVLDYTGSSAQGWLWIFLALSVSHPILSIIYCFMIDSEPIIIKPKALENPKTNETNKESSGPIRANLDKSKI